MVLKDLLQEFIDDRQEWVAFRADVIEVFPESPKDYRGDGFPLELHLTFHPRSCKARTVTHDKVLERGMPKFAHGFAWYIAVQPRPKYGAQGEVWIGIELLAHPDVTSYDFPFETLRFNGSVVGRSEGGSIPDKRLNQQVLFDCTVTPIRWLGFHTCVVINLPTSFPKASTVEVTATIGELTREPSDNVQLPCTSNTHVAETKAEAIAGPLTTEEPAPEISDDENSQEEPEFKPTLLDISVNVCDAAMTKKSLPPEVYKNLSKPKGLAMIINNINFRTTGPRTGTNFDEANIRRLLDLFDYKVLDTFEDLKGEEMMDEAKKFATDKRHAKCDSCVVVVLTHGMQNTLMGVDDEGADVHELVSCFHASKAPLLAGKPKIFILQACRGDKFDGVDVPDHVAHPLRKLIRWFRPARNRAQERMQPGPSSHVTAGKLPEGSDVLIAYATPLNYVSWRNKENGSWFIEEICNVFKENAASNHILELLTMVHREVAKNHTAYPRNCHKCPGRDCVGHVQIPNNQNTFTKLFYFFPGVTSK